MEVSGNLTADAENLRSQFLQLLRTRRTAQVPLTVEPAEPVLNPLYQEVPPPTFSEAMESCPKADIPNLKEVLEEENIYLHTEEGEQGKLPVLILSMKESNQQKRPAVVFLHSTHKCKEWLRPLLEAYASRGYVAIAVDSRYHGERASTLTTYKDALVSSWKNGDTMPFIFDTVWDLIKLADYLTQREDIDPARIGITGESLGGMHAWFAAFADTRYTVVAPIIGIQGFRWAIENDKWEARVNSIRAVFEEARIDLGKDKIDKDVVEKVWDRIAPGLASQFDSLSTVPTIAPRPLLILNGAEDPRCPIAGLEISKTRALKAYEEANCSDKFKLITEPEIGHQMTSLMVKEATSGVDQSSSVSDDADADKIRSEFLHLLRTRRTPLVPLSVEPAKPVLHPLFQGGVPASVFREAMESSPKADIKNLKERLKEENLYLATEAYASREYIAIAIDSRYHGERAHNLTTSYTDALVSAWKKGDTMPFIFDTVWDLIKLADYLTQRKDIDPTRIGITGVSLGGMHAWFAAFADTRYAVAAPILGVQGFRWAIDKNKWQARVDSIKPVFEEARIDLGKSEIDKEVVKKVWDRIAPGLASKFDSPYSVPAIAPRPLLILNGAIDPRGPLDGIKTPVKRARKAYEKAHSSNKFKLMAQPGIAHQLTPLMVKEASDWFDQFLK
ncbi:hypothetical protein COLO4_18679 [Corchorus olitorius]|uniref:Peptidase S9 prolyl oligopeptidase catalytic domain-containing protein n=1 Tax=Corchorus olitorius TaxID=93759 RepID=A0A1R3J854_9ROSI|nr:hypothetical protein COLO4_18679 [Corchorus olitorius]